MKFQLVLICLALLARASFSLPADQERSKVLSKLQSILAELEGENNQDLGKNHQESPGKDLDKNHQESTGKDTSKLEGAELMKDVDVSDKNLDKFKESGDKFILDSDKTGALLEEFRKSVGSQAPVKEGEKDKILPFRSESMAQPEQDDDDDEEDSDDDREDDDAREDDDGAEDDDAAEDDNAGEDADTSDVSQVSGSKVVVNKDHQDSTGKDGSEEDDGEDNDEVDDLSLNDEEVDELNLDTMVPEKKKVTQISDFEQNSKEQAHPESPDDFVSQILSDLNSEE